MLVAGVEGCCKPKVHPDATAHELFTIEFLADCDGGVNFEEGHNDSLERLQRRPRMHRTILVDRFADLYKI